MMYAIGPTDTVMLFQSIGIKAIKIKDEQELKEAVERISNDAKIIFISEALKPLIADIKRKYDKLTYPIITLIPMEGEVSNLGVEKLKKDVERAIGMALL